MILVDTLVWIDHLRQKDDHLVITLLAGHVLIHLLASTKLSGATLWIRDKRLLIVAKEMNIAYPEILH